MTIANGVAVVMLVSLTLYAGLQADLAQVVRSLRRGWLLARVALVNVIVVPLTGALVVRAFAVAEPIANGILLMAVAPGVPFLLFRIRNKGGSADLALALAVLLPILSIVTVPPTLRVLVGANAAAAIPLARVVTTLVLFQLVPIALGVALSTWLPAAAKRLERIIAVLVPVTVVVFIVLFVPSLWRSVGALFGSRGILAIVCIVIVSLIVGLLAGGKERDGRRTCALGTMLRNVGFAAAMAASCFADPIVSDAVIAYLAIQIVLSLVTSSYFTASAKRAKL